MNAQMEIAKLKDGECWVWPEGDCGKAEIWLKHGTLFLFEIPMYGGEPMFYGSYQRVEDLVQTVMAWT